MNRIRVLLIVLMVVIALPMAMAQGITTEGKEFWLTYMHNGYRDHPDGGWVETQVLVSAKRSCTGTISNPNTGWRRNFSVAANSVITINVPETQGYHGVNYNEVVANKGLKVVTSDTVSVYCTNIAQVSFDGSFVLPVESLGSEYRVITHEQSRVTTGSGSFIEENLTSSFVVVATEDNTQVSITPSRATLGGHAAGVPFTVTLNAGQTYQVRSSRLNSEDARNLTGSCVVAADGKKIAVFNGNTLTCVPTGQTTGFDHIFEQAMPIETWGKEFCVTNSRQRHHDFITIYSGSNNNVITRNGLPWLTLQEGGYAPSVLIDTSVYIQSTKPIGIYLYNTSSWDDGPLNHLGDPSMTWIAPMEQRVENITFTTFDHDEANIEFHFVNIVASAVDINRVYLDNTVIPSSEFTPVVGCNGQYYYVQKAISHGLHNLHCAGGVTAHVYGFGTDKGYAYMAGSSTNPLTAQLLIENIPSSQLPNGYDACQNETIHFDLQLNYDMSHANWDFGDGSTGIGAPIAHAYTAPGDYTVSVNVYQSQYDEDVLTSTLTGLVHVYPTYETMETQVACVSYTWHGQTYTQSGTYTNQGQSIHGCDSISTLQLTIIPEINVHIEVEGNQTEICEGDSVVLHAIVDRSAKRFFAVGDILCSDAAGHDTIVKPANWPVEGKVAKGIVFYVDNSLSHGWAVALNQTENVIWSVEDTLVGSPHQHWRDAIMDLDGYSNTKNIRSGSNATTYPAAWAVDFAHGWYLPSAGQLNLLFGELFEVNASLTAIGATPITDLTGGNNQLCDGDIYLWSSTEVVSDKAIALEILNGGVISASKGGSSVKQYVVRGVLDF